MLRTKLSSLQYQFDAFLFTRLENCKKKRKALLTQNDALGTIEMVLIIVVLISLVVIFKDRIQRVLKYLSLFHFISRVRYCPVSQAVLLST